MDNPYDSLQKNAYICVISLLGISPKNVVKYFHRKIDFVLPGQIFLMFPKIYTSQMRVM